MNGVFSEVRRGRWAVSALFFANGFVLGSWAPQIPLLLPRHAITEGVLGLLIFGMGFGAMVAMAASGRSIGRYGSRRVLQVATIGTALALPAVVLAPTLAITALAIAVFGAMVSTMDVALNANAVEVETRLGRAVLSSTHGFWSLGGFFGGMTGGSLIAALGASGHAALVATLVLGLAAATFRPLIDEPRAPAAPRAPSGAEGRIWAQPTAVLVLGAMALLAFVPESAVLDWSALYLTGTHSSDVSATGLAFALFSGVMAALRFVGDPVRDRFGAVAILRVSGLAGATGLLIAGLAPTQTIAILGFALTGLGLANMVPIIFSAAGRQGGDNPGAAIAAVSFIGYSGMLVGPSIIGFVADSIGLRAAFIGLSVFLLAVGFLARRADPVAPAPWSPSGRGTVSGTAAGQSGEVRLAPGEGTPSRR